MRPYASLVSLAAVVGVSRARKGRERRLRLPDGVRWHGLVTLLPQACVRTLGSVPATSVRSLRRLHAAISTFALLATILSGLIAIRLEYIRDLQVRGILCRLAPDAG